MKKNYKESIVSLIGGAGAFPILMWIFMDVLDFGLAIIIAFVFFMIAGILNGLLVETPGRAGPLILQEPRKQAILSLVGGIGVVIILLGLFSPVLSFQYSIVISYGFFLPTGVLDKLIEVEQLDTRYEHYYPTAKKTFHKGGQEKVKSRKSDICHSCGKSIQVNDIFCATCGAEQTNYS